MVKVEICWFELNKVSRILPLTHSRLLGQDWNDFWTGSAWNHELFIKRWKSNSLYSRIHHMIFVDLSSVVILSQRSINSMLKRRRTMDFKFDGWFTFQWIHAWFVVFRCVNCCSLMLNDESLKCHAWFSFFLDIGNFLENLAWRSWRSSRCSWSLAFSCGFSYRLHTPCCGISCGFPWFTCGLWLHGGRVQGAQIWMFMIITKMPSAPLIYLNH